MFNQKNNHVGITFDQTRLTCSWITKPHPHKNSFHLNAYESYPVHYAEYKESIIYNMTFFKHHIGSFLKKHNLEHSFITISLAGSGLHEKIISIATELPQEQHFSSDTDDLKLIWDYSLINYNHNTKKYTYYLCGITREKLFQQQLLALMTPYKCIKIVPQREALIHACRYLYPHVWKNTTINNHASLQSFIHYSIDQCNITPLFDNAASLAQQEKSHCIESLGLFLAGIETYERY